MKSKSAARPSSSISRLALAAALALGAGTAAQAQVYWDGTSASWNVNTNWSTASGATTPDPLSAPGSADDAIFNVTTVNAAINITLDAAQAANSLTFNNTGTTTFRATAASAAAQTLTIGTGGITVVSTAGNVTFNDTPATYGVLTLATGATTQTWTNNATLLSAGPVTGSGTLNLSGANSTSARNISQFSMDLSAYTGNLAISNARLVNTVATNGFGTLGTLTINNGAQLALNVANTTVSRTLSIAGNGWFDTGSGDTQRGAIRFLQNGSFSNTVTLTGNSRLFADTTRTGTFSGKITGAFGIEINGGPNSTGTIIFSNSGNDYSGTTTISGGQLRIDHANALGNSTNITTSGSSNAALVLNSVTIGTGKTIKIKGQGNQNLYGALSTSSTNTASIWQSAVTIDATSGTRIGSEAGTLTVSGDIGQSAAGSKLSIRNNGSAATILSGNNTFSGGLDLIVGGLRMGSANALGNSAGIFTIANGTNAVVFSSDGTTARNIVNPTAVTGTSGITIGDASNNGKLTFSNTFDLGTSVRPLAIASEVEISGAVGGTGGGINKSGVGVLTLSGNNNYTGLTTLSAGQLNLNANTAINGAGGFTVSAAATLDNTSASPVTLTNAGTVTLSNNLTFNGTRGLTFSGNLNQTADLTVTMKGTAGLSLGNYTNTKAGDITLNVYDDNSGNAAALTVGSMALSNSATSRLLTLGNNNLADGKLIVSGVISNGGTATASSITTNYMNVTLEGNNTFAGGLTLSGGTLNMNNAGALGTGTFAIVGGTLNNTSAASITNSKNNAITVNSDFTFTGTKDLNLGTGAVSLGTAAGTARQITVSGGILTLGGAISNGTTANALNKAGAGTLILGGSNGYTGATSVKNGTVQLTGSLSTSTSIVLGDSANNGKFILGGAGGVVNQTVTGLTISGTGTTNAVVGGNAAVSTLTVNVASGTNTYTGFLGGSGTNENNLAITKTGAGGLTLGLSSSVAPIANTFTGGVDIQAGVVTLANALGSGGQVATPGGNASGVFYLGNSSGTSTAELAISNNNITFNNPINVRSGSSGTKTFRISGSSVNASHGGTITLNDNLTASTAATSSTLTLNGVIQDGVSGAKGITVNGGLVVVSNTNIYTGTTSVTGGTLTATKAAALPGYNSSGKVVINGGTLQVRVAGSGWTTTELASLVTNATKTSGSLAIDTVNGNFTPTSALNIGALGLVKNGVNTLTLDQANSFTGSVTVNAGTLKIADSGALGTGTKTLTSTGGSRVVELSGGVTLGSNISLSISSNSGDGLGLSSIDGDNEIQGSINYTSGNPALNVSSSGTSKLTISGNLTYTVANNTRIMYLGGNSTAANVISGNVSQSGTGAILRVWKQNTGTWELSGTNSYTGDTRILDGTLSINSIKDYGTNSSIGAAASGDVVIGSAATTGTLLYTGGLQSSNRTIQIGTNSGTAASTDTGGATIRNDGTGALTFSATSFNTAETGVIASTARVLTLGGSNTGDNTISGVIQDNTVGASGTGAVAVTKQDAGKWILSGTNTYSGLTTVSNGTLLATKATALPGYNEASRVSVASGATLAVRAGGSGEWIPTEIDSVLDATTAAFASGSNLGIDVTTSNSFSYSSDIGATQVAKGLVKSGAGTLTLTGANTYTGATTVAAGVLAIAGSGSLGATSVTVQDTATLQGSGTIAGSVTIQTGGTLSPGNSPGTLTQTAGTLSLKPGGNYNWQIYDADGTAGTGYDTYALSGSSLDLSSLSSTNRFNINVWSLSAISPDANGNALNFNNSTEYSWTLFSTASLISGFNSNLFNINTSAINGTTGFSNFFGTGQFVVGLGDGGTDLVLNYIPEPSTTTLGLLAAAGLLLRRRRNA